MVTSSFSKTTLVVALFFSATIWSSLSGAQTQTFDDGSTLQQFDDGSTLATGTDGSVTSTDATDGTQGRSASNAAGGESATCDSAAKTANSACMLPGTDGMDSGTAAMYTMMLTAQLPQMATQIASVGKNMSQQCKLQGDVAKIMTAINGIKATACGVTISKCNTVCEREIQQHRQTANTLSASNTYGQNTPQITKENAEAGRKNGLSNKCSSYSGQVVGMMYATMQNGANFVVNKQCEKDMAALAAAPTSSLPPLPTVGDCTDPNNQSYQCMCQKDAYKSTPMCAGFTNVAGGGTTVTPNGNGSTATPYTSTASTSGEDGNTVDPFGGDKKKGSGGPNGMGDGGGSAPGGGGLSALSSEGGSGGGNADKSSAITGTSGGNSSGLGGAGGGGGGGGLARNGNGAAGGFFDKFNLKKFLPGSKFKTRGIAGMSVKSVDGITGPMGPSIWEKATRQYQEQIQKQNVILEK